MSAVRRAPLTYGQLSVLRSLAVHGEEGAAVANLSVIWEVPPGPDVTQIVDAWSRLVQAHESLRTTFGRDASGAFEQTVHPLTSPALPVVELPDVTREEAERVAAELAAEPIDVACDLPWRATVVTEQSDPVYLVAVVHHVAADNDALRVLETAFYEALDGAEVVADGQPADLVLAQRERSDARALAHWTAVWPSLDGADREPCDRSPRRRASLYSLDALAAAMALSERLRVSVQSLVLSVGVLAVARHENRERVSFVLMAANRIDPRQTGLVTSLNQYAPVTVTVAEDIAPDDFLTAVYPACLTAYTYGSYDVDALAAALAEAGTPDPDPTAFAKHFNFLGPVDFEPAAGSPLRSGVAWRGSAQRTGPNLHLAVAVGDGLLIGVGASEDALPGRGPAVLAAGIEAGLLRLADGGVATLSDLDLTPVRPLRGPTNHLDSP